MQTTSTQNSVIQRFRPGLNGKVNYPIKRAMTDIAEPCEYDICDPVLKYCVLGLLILFMKMLQSI